ncbi:MAG: hypothetical protein F6K42_05450 [Leptolyngbya sp. SIO1D8]|nr:hypothetical protein [Leptolyngbya sp. SIO1D8]
MAVNTAEVTNESRRPDMILYLIVKDSPSATKGRWIRIGGAWGHKDGGGFGINFDLLPIRMPGKHYTFTMRVNEVDESEQGEQTMEDPDF